jgi:hypothetical protein
MARKKPNGSMRLLRAYMFRDKDPAIDALRTVIQDSTGDRALKSGTLRTIAEDGGPTLACMQGWFRGDTKRPQNATLEAAGRAVGMRRVWVKHKD